MWLVITIALIMPDRQAWTAVMRLGALMVHVETSELFCILLETHKHQNLMKLRLPIACE